MEDSTKNSQEDSKKVEPKPTKYQNMQKFLDTANQAIMVDQRYRLLYFVQTIIALLLLNSGYIGSGYIVNFVMFLLTTRLLFLCLEPSYLYKTTNGLS